MRRLAIILALLLLPTVFRLNGAQLGIASDSASPIDQAVRDIYVPPAEDINRPAPTVGPDGYLENGWLIWEELMPAGWNPASIFEELEINDMADDDPRIEGIIERFLEKWNASPINAEIDQKPMRIPGFVVPLDFDNYEVSEFFLVPFFGACIHVPPPPPNQIIMVHLKEPFNGLAAMEVVWVYGKISIERYTNELGSAGYTLNADKVEFYQLDSDG
ncbi:MAG: DUF3299 domain-containing protein [Deltaproteobacteria bacterium]|nr:DUF3299 domain-containing protein [Deltaproteobacteria bacterium]